jgi:hypothetical protein
MRKGPTVTPGSNPVRLLHRRQRLGAKAAVDLTKSFVALTRALNSGLALLKNARSRMAIHPKDVNGSYQPLFGRS